ncbi:hypothetical protein N9986_00855 [Akkermansiaceae bacterium]|nr:hypothetical protein [Akkermansiaceae bacterium]
MADVSEERHQVRAKLALIGPPGAGKQEIFRQLSKQQGSGPLHHRRVGEADVYQASWDWSGVPSPAWTTHLTAYTTVWKVEFNAITEMLLDGVDGIIFCRSCRSRAS